MMASESALAPAIMPMSDIQSKPESMSMTNHPPAAAHPLVDGHTIEFTTTSKVIDEIKQASGNTDILVVTNVSFRDFDAIQRAYKMRGMKFRFRRYYYNDRILIIGIPTHLHVQLHTALFSQLTAKITRMGLHRSYKNIGSATYKANWGNTGGDEGEADSALGPRPDRTGPREWPTLVIEAGYDESLTGLRHDMEWWFNTSNHQVKIVLLAKFHRHQNCIQLEKWEEHQQGNRPGATTTRSVSQLVPVNRQTIDIIQDATVSPPTYNVTRGALVLDFSLVFLRPPNISQGEGDFVFTVEDLKWYAELVWAQVE